MKLWPILVVVAALALPAEAASPPNKEIARLKRQVTALKVKLGRLQRQYDLLARNQDRILRQNSALRAHVAAVDPCPITHPNGSAPPGEPGFNHGNGQLWVALWGSNVYVDVPGDDGSIPVKLGWFRGIPGQLEVGGRLLGGGAAFWLTATEGYGETGFQPVGIDFPSPGCWEVTGRAGGASLTFVTLVLGA